MKKKVLILGGSSDIGIETAKIFLDNNWEVCCHYNSSKKNKIIKNENLSYYKLNFLENEKKINREIKKITSRRFDSIINLVGYIDNKTFDNFSISDLLNSIKVNSAIPLYIIKKSLPKMIIKNYGRILQTSSIGVKFGGGIETFNYSVSKKTNEFIPNKIRKLASKNIFMNTLVIGATKTKIHKMLKNKNLTKRKKLIPVKRMADASEIANYIYFLSSDKNTYITGQKLAITGGE